MIYIKIFGGFLTFLASSMLGYCITLKSQKRVVELENLKLYMHVFENEIRYNSSDIIEATENSYKSASEHNKIILDLFLKYSSDSQGQPLSTVWKKSVSNSKSLLCYNKDDIYSIVEFGEILGSGDAETQLKNIDVFIKKLSDNIENSKLKLSGSEKIFSKLGIYTGLLIVVFLI